MHEGKLKPEDLDQEAINATYKELYDAGRQGYGEDWVSFPGDGKGSLVNELKKNLYMFSGAKFYSQLVAMNDLLFDQEGKLRPYNQFEALARKLNRQYNRNWLQAEWQTARTAAQMAQKWQRLQETKDLFPNLEFRTVGDDRVREKHRQLHGIIKPIDDVFWKQYYPPLDWRCRCDVVATAAEPKGNVPKDMPTPNFVGNVALDQEIFTKKGNFFKLLNSDENAKRNMELMKLNAPYELAYKSKDGKKVMVNIFKDPVDHDKNLDAAIILTEEVKINVFIRPHIDIIRPKGSNIPSNAEYLINGKLSDLKWNFKENNYNGIKSAIDSAKNQGCKSIVFDFTHSFKNLDITKVNQALRGKITETRGKWVEDVYLIYETRAIKVTREEILQDKLLEKLENLKADSK